MEWMLCSGDERQILVSADIGLWDSGRSLLIYQHFTREKRVHFIERKLDELRKATPGSFVEAFLTPHVVFFMTLQPPHRRFHPAIVDSVQKRWAGQIQFASFA